ncbi:MAG TPA: type II secretion system protein GspL [Casimicrobiaceae bacterium]|nr:type II secretion system protein GspL [Casimicrobiaceae bacterium]
MAQASTTLRVFVDEPPQATRAAPWALYDAAGHLTRSGSAAPAAWPEADRVEAVIAAAHGRVAALELPPLPPGRADAAVRYALEDQLADAPDESHVALAPQNADGGLRAAIVAGAWMSAFVEGSRRCDIDWDRAVLESDLAPSASSVWRWCASSIGRAGFVSTDRGATIAVGAAHGDDPPAELALALARAGSGVPRTVRVDADGAGPAFLAAAGQATGIAFAAGTPWRWAEASPSAYARAIDLLSGRFGPEPRLSSRATARMFRPALWIAAIALSLHIAATLGQWAWLRWQSFAMDRELTALARAAVPGFGQGGAADAAPALALAHRERDLKHRAGLTARDDFLPLLSRAAPVLASLPRGALRSLSYADSHLLLDLGQLDAKEPSRLQSELRQLGLVAIVAPTQAGTRLRIGWD